MKLVRSILLGRIVCFVAAFMAISVGPEGIRTPYAQVLPANADFSADVTSGDAPLTVNFTDRSTGNIAGYAWDFGDGDSSQDQNPTHQYTQAGTYTVKLTVTQPNGLTDEEVKSEYIFVSEGAIVLTAAFTASPTSGLPPLIVNFTDASTGGAVRWEWDFDNNGVVDSTVQNPGYVYNEEGSYSVKLTVYDNANGVNTVVKTNYIRASTAVASSSLIQITSIDSTITDFPAAPRVPITFTTRATSNTSGTLYYKYYILPDYCTGNYDSSIEAVRDYSTENGFTWTPTEEGKYVVVVRVTDQIEDVCPAVGRFAFGVFLLGELVVEVKDAVTGEPIQGATVRIGALSATTDARGKATISDVATGTYRLKVSQAGYITAEQDAAILGNETVTKTVALSPGLAEGQTRIVLTWGATPRDLDSHLTGPDGSGGQFHVYYGDRAPGGAGANLDVDDVTSYGPETITITEMRPGNYAYHILDYTTCHCNNPGVDPNTRATALGSSGARIDIYSGSALLNSFQVPSGYGTNWHVFNINGETGEIIPVNTLGGGTGPTGGGGGSTAFCEDNPGYCVGNLEAPDDDTKGVAWDGTNMWLCEGGHAFSVIFKMNIETGECLDYFFTPGPNAQGLAFDGTHLWSLDQTDHKIYKIDPATKAVLGSVPTPTSDVEDLYTGLAWDGQYFWVCGYRMAFNEETHLYDISDPAVYRMTITTTPSLTETATTSLTIPLGEDQKMPLGLAFDGSKLYVSSYNSPRIWVLNPETGAIEGEGIQSPDQGTYGMTWDGLYLWAGSWYERGVIQLNPRHVPSFTQEGMLTANILTISSGITSLPNPVNRPVTFTVTAKGQGPTLYYKYLIAPQYCTTEFGQTWQVLRDFSQNRTYTWNPSGEDKFLFRVLVTDDLAEGCQATGDLTVVIGNGNAGGGEAGSPGGTR